MPIAAIVLIVAMALLLPIEARAAPPPKVEFQSAQHILGWINTYRARPEPEKLPKAVQAMSAFGVFRDLEASGIYVGFMAGVIADNPDKAEKLIAGMFPIPPEDQVAVVRAIAYSGASNWKDLL